MKEKLSSDSIQTLLDSSDYREFIKALIAEKSKYKKFGFSDIARNGGFASRSFPRDVANGDKRITLASLPKMIKGLGLNSDLADYFRLLVEVSHPDCRTKDIGDVKLYACLENLKFRLSNKSHISIESKNQAYANRNTPAVYAALGNKDSGASVATIQSRTNLSENEVFETLKFLIELKLVEKKQGKYYLTENHVNLQGLKTNEFFKKHFLHLADKSVRSAHQKFNSDEALYLSSAFSVRKSELPKLKDELRSLLLKYIDSSEKAEGDKVVNLVTALF